MKNSLNLDNSLKFILAGNALMTFQNKETGNRYTYKVRSPKNKKGIHFVSVLYGPDNTTNYTYIGTIFSEKDFVHTQKSRVQKTDTRFKVFDYVFNHLNKKDLSNKIEIYHEGKCGCCGRTLTVPESIEIGLGPHCANKI